MKLIDICLNFLVKLGFTGLYIFFIFIFSFVFAFGEVWALDKCGVKYNSLSKVDSMLLVYLIIFIVTTCVVIILASEVLIWLLKLQWENADTIYYEFIDNTYKFLAVWGVLLQIRSMTDEDLSAKISISVLLGILIGLQQLALKIWFKTMRSSEDVNFLQTVYDTYLINQYKDRLQKPFSSVRAIVDGTKADHRRNILKEACKVLYEKRYLEVIKRYEKDYKNAIEILESKELKGLSDRFKEDKNINNKDINVGIEKIKLIAQALQV